MQRWTMVATLALVALVSGCATVRPDPGTPDPVQLQRDAQEAQRLRSVGFQAGAKALGSDSLAGVPIDVYRLPSDPDRDAFADTPSRLKTAWEFQIVKLQPLNGCLPDAPPILALHLVFADEAVGQAFPLSNNWPIDCRRPTVMPSVFRTPKGVPSWVMFPAPRVDPSSIPPKVHFLTQHEVKASTPGLPLSVASLVASEPMTVTLRWRARTAAGSILPWTTQTLVVRPVAVFTEPYCDALRGASTTSQPVKDALVQHDCGDQPVLPEGLRTTP